MKLLKNVTNKHLPVNLFFTEIILALLFFSISAAVILKIFATADRRSRLSSEKENAMICAQSIAEAYSQSGNVGEALKTVFSESADIGENGGKYTLSLDKLCKPSIDGDVLMEASEEREKTDAGELARLTITFGTEKEELYSLACSAYIPVGGSSDE